MLFTLNKASDYRYTEPVEISTMEGLKTLSEIYGCPVIVDFDDMTLTIYDDYME